MTIVEMTPEEATAAILRGDPPAALRVTGDLRLYQNMKRQQTADGEWISIDTNPPPLALPTDYLEAGDIIIHNGSALKHWPQTVHCRELYLWNYQWDIPPESEIVITTDRSYSYREVVINRCPQLTTLAGLRLAPATRIEFGWCSALQTLPDGLQLQLLRLNTCDELQSLPADLQVDHLEVMLCSALTTLPAGMEISELAITDCASMQALPEDLRVTTSFTLNNTPVTRLPAGITAPTIDIRQCAQLRQLPTGLAPLYLSIANCPQLDAWEEPGIRIMRQLNARGCQRLRALPPNLAQIDELDLAGCTSMTALPPRLRIRRWVDLAETGVTSLPPSDQGTQIRWNGVAISGQVAFHPETLTAAQILAEGNAEVRRVMMERLGIERFVADAQPTILDTDSDRGGPRQLIRVTIPNDEDLVALMVRDPSTARTYLLRVPPIMQTCHQAAAWMAGFDDPDAYQPDIET